jgi:hypothetical protein
MLSFGYHVLKDILTNHVYSENRDYNTEAIIDGFLNRKLIMTQKDVTCKICEIFFPVSFQTVEIRLMGRNLGKLI